MNSSNSFRLTSFFVPTNKTKGQFGVLNKASILLMPILLYSAASLIVSVTFSCIGIFSKLSDIVIAYNYNENDEYNQDYCISHDMGKTWDEPAKTYFAKRIRNPQICQAGGIYFMHGRSGGVSGELPFNFVLYTSKDGINWDEGEYVRVTPENGWGGYSYYSNNCVTGRFGGEKRILIQASDPYDKARVNIKHWWIDISNE